MVRFLICSSISCLFRVAASLAEAPAGAGEDLDSSWWGFEEIGGEWADLDSSGDSGTDFSSWGTESEGI